MTPPTNTSIIVPETATSALGTLLATGGEYAHQARSANTWRAYRSDLKAFVAWCDSRGLPSLPALAETVVAYVVARVQAGSRVSSIERALAALSEAHRAAGHEAPRSHPLVRNVMKGIRRTHGVAPAQKAPILARDLKAMLCVLPDNLLGLRDRALLLVGFAGAFRRSELVELDLADLNFTENGVEITIRRSKTDQEAAGRKIGLPYASTPATCPTRVLRAWLDTAGILEGPVFRPVNRHGHVGRVRLRAHAVARVVKRTAMTLGLDPARFSGHSLRAGLATAAAAAGKSERAIMAQTGHRSVTMVRRYIRDGELFLDNAAAGLL